MAPEVISLLSSPEPDTLPPKASTRTSKTLGGFGQIVHNQASTALYEALDRIPESSNPGLSAQPRNGDWWQSSDEFDVTGELRGGDDNHEALFLDTRPNKRLRVSESPFGSPLSSKATSNLINPAASRSMLPRPTAPSSPPRALKQAKADVIELSSSPSGSPTLTERRTTATAQPDTFVDGGISDSSVSNPFLSSSPLPRQSKGPVVNAAAKGREQEVPSGGHPRFSPKKSVIWDPISSSAPASNGGRSSPPPRPLQRSRSDVIALSDSDLGSGSDGSSDDEFPDDLAKIKAMRLKRRPGASNKSRSKPSKPVSSRHRAGAAAPKKNAEEREAERAQKRLEKDLAKEAAKRERELEKERRAQEKKQAAALAEVNKIRTDKKVSTPEMLVDLPASLPETTRLQAELLLHDLEVDFHPWTSPVENVVKWRRKVRARYNEALGHWEPIPMFVQDEKHAMAVLTASQFVDLVVPDDDRPDTSGGAGSLSAHIAAMKLHFPSHTLIYLIEGLTPWLRKNRNVRDRHFQAAVRNGLAPAAEAEPASTATSRRKKAAPAAAVYVDEDLVEDALLSLQVRHGALIHHTSAPLETARQIAIFTQHLSTLPYRRIKDAVNSAAAGFCMDVGQVKTGDGPRDTYARMLQEITRVTAPIAYGIVGEFGTVGRLVRGMEEGGPLRLEDVRRCADREGTVADRRVGQAVSRRVWKVFTGLDEGSMDI